MDEKPKALLAMHDERWQKIFTRSLNRAGYEVISAQSVDEMLEKMGIPQNAGPAASPINQFIWYIMDTNLGSPNNYSYEPVLRIYRHIQDSVEKKEVYFMSLTGNNQSINEAKKAGIPCMDKCDGADLTDIIENS